MTKPKITFCNEEKLLKEEKERLRKLRIIQVREIAKQNAANVREAFRTERDKHFQKIVIQQQSIQKHEHQENFDEVKQLVQKEIDIIGQGHLSAANYDDQKELRLKIAIENEEKAKIRGITALVNEKEEKKTIENKENAHIIARQNALEQEKIRSSKIAKLPKPVNELEQIINKKPTKLVSFHDVDVFMNTRYHMPEAIVDKATSEENKNFDARKNAEDEELRLKKIEKEIQRQNNERLEKAHLRGKHALEKEILNDNYNNILNELSILQQADREKRQKELGNIPKEIFLPSWQREQEKNEFQLELERQFEKIYVDSNMRKEEMPQPVDLKQLDISQNNLEDTDLDLTILNDEQMNKELDHAESILQELKQHQHQQQIQEMIQQQKQENMVKTKENIPAQITQPIVQNENNKDTSNQTSASNNKNQSERENLALGKLLDKLKKQREEIAQKSSTIENNISFDDSVASDNLNHQPLGQPIKENETCNKKAINKPIIIDANESDKIEIGLIDDMSKDSELDNYENENEDELSYSLSLTSNTPKSDYETNNKSSQLTKKEKNLLRGVMMSSHNVSSINEMIDSNRLILNAKIISSNNRRGAITRQSQNNDDNIFSRNTATYSIDLSHASRDPMVAGPRELFNKNDIKLAIELKQKELQKQQEELEQKLKQLEEQQVELEKETSVKQQTVSQQTTKQKPPNSSRSSVGGNGAGLISNTDSGNDQNFLSDSIDNSSLTLSHSVDFSNRPKQNENQGLSEDDLRRIEYQKYLLTKIVNKQEKQKVEADKQIDTIKLIEDRKREIQKKFGIDVQSSSSSSFNTNEYNSVNKKPPLAQSQHLSNHHQQLLHDDKHTICSGDSGFVSSSNHFNMNLRNQNNMQVKKPINLAVEQLNKEIINVSKSNLAKQQQLQQYAQTELVNYLNGEINEDEYRRRLSSISNSSLINNSSLLTNEQISKLFGLEFYDSTNMTDIRDSSIERLFGWSIHQQQQQQQQQQMHEPKSKSSGLFSKTTDSESSNDTLNDQEQDSFHDISFNANNNNNKNNKLKANLNDSTDNENQEDEDGQSLIMSILNSKNSSKSNKNNLNMIDLKRQFIQDQLDIVRRQKDQLEQQQGKVINHPSNQNHNSAVNHLPPPVKINKFINDVNLHELSTIKEVDTPISERNIKLTSNSLSRQQMNNNNNNNKSSINLTTVSSMDFSSSSLENVTQLSESNLPMQSANVNNNNNITNANSQTSVFQSVLTSMSPSNSLFNTTLNEENSQSNKNQNKSASSSSTSFTSTSTPLTANQASKQNNQSQHLLNLEALRQKQMQLLNISLFDSSNSNTSNQSSSLSSPVNQTNVTKKIDYGELIFDSLVTNNLTISSLAQQMSSLTFNQTSMISPNQQKQQKPVAFKTESTNSSFLNKSSFNTNNNNSNKNNLNFQNPSGKKWFDILASSTDDEKSIKEQSYKQDKSLKESKGSSNSIYQDLIAETTLNNDPTLNENNDPNISSSSSTSFLHSLIQYPMNKSSLLTASPSVLINASFGSTTSQKITNKKSDNLSFLQSEKTFNSSDQNYSLKDLEPINKSVNINTKLEETTGMKMTTLVAEMTNVESSSGVATETTRTSFSSTKNDDKTSGLFDRFLKNYSSTTGASVMDEPEISFVSYKTNSNPNSPKFASRTLSNQFTDYSTNTKSELSNQSSNCSNLSLIQIQQRQLSKQFANVSPIDEINASNLDNLRDFKSFSTTIPFETTSNITSFMSKENEKRNSLISEKSLNVREKTISSSSSSSIIEGVLNDDEDDDENNADHSNDRTLSSSSSSIIEGRLTVPFDLTSVSKLKEKNFHKTSFEFSMNQTSNSVEKQTFQTNQLTNVSSLNSLSRKSDSLISFEDHEFSQMTPLKNNPNNPSSNKSSLESSLISKPINHFDDYDDNSDVTQIPQDSTIISKQQLSYFTKSNNSPMCNSTPMVSLCASSLTSTFNNQQLNSQHQSRICDNLNDSNNDQTKNSLNYFYFKPINDSCCVLSNKSCSYCQSFYSEPNFKDKFKKKELNIDLRNQIAKNVTQELYFVDFDGNRLDLDNLKEFNLKNNNKYDLQKSCLKHLNKIRKFSRIRKSKETETTRNNKLIKYPNHKTKELNKLKKTKILYQSEVSPNGIGDTDLKKRVISKIEIESNDTKKDFDPSFDIN